MQKKETLSQIKRKLVRSEKWTPKTTVCCQTYNDNHRGGQETVRTIDMDECIGAIIGEVSLSGVQSDILPDSDLPQLGNIPPAPDSIHQDQPARSKDNGKHQPNFFLSSRGI